MFRLAGHLPRLASQTGSGGILSLPVPGGGWWIAGGSVASGHHGTAGPFASPH